MRPILHKVRELSPALWLLISKREQSGSIVEPEKKSNNIMNRITRGAEEMKALFLSLVTVSHELGGT